MDRPKVVRFLETLQGIFAIVLLIGLLHQMGINYKLKSCEGLSIITYGFGVLSATNLAIIGFLNKMQRMAWGYVTVALALTVILSQIIYYDFLR